MCSTERSNAPPGHVKGVLEGREGGALVGVGVGAGWHKDMLFNHKVPWQQESTSLSYSFCFCPPPHLYLSAYSQEECCSPLRSISLQVIG